MKAVWIKYFGKQDHASQDAWSFCYQDAGFLLPKRYETVEANVYNKGENWNLVEADERIKHSTQFAFERGGRDVKFK